MTIYTIFIFLLGLLMGAVLHERDMIENFRKYGNTDGWFSNIQKSSSKRLNVKVLKEISAKIHKGIANIKIRKPNKVKQPIISIKDTKREDWGF